MSHSRCAKSHCGNSVLFIQTRSSKKTSDNLRGLRSIPAPKYGTRLCSYKGYNIEGRNLEHKDTMEFFVVSIEKKELVDCFRTLQECVDCIDAI